MSNAISNEDLELRLAILHMAFALERAGPILFSLALNRIVQRGG